jgi:hypothetical protein
MALSDQLFESFIEATAATGELISISKVWEQLTGSGLPSRYFCWLPNLCDDYPESFDLDFAVAFNKDTQIKFMDGNLWSIHTKQIRIVAKKGGDLLHDFVMNEINGQMNLFINQEGSIEGSVQNLHFKDGSIVTPAKCLVAPKQIGWIAGSFQYWQALANNYLPDNNHIRLNTLPFGIFAKTLDLQYREGYLYFGFDIDPIYIGLP